MSSNPNGPDSMMVLFRGLAPQTCYSVFLTQSIVTGSTPGSLLAGFCSDASGEANIRVLTEITESFVFFNRRLDRDGDGIVVGQAAGAFANGGFMVPTPIVRVYRAQPDQGVATVFSADPRSPGGLHTLSSTPIRGPRMRPPADVREQRRRVADERRRIEDERRRIEADRERIRREAEQRQQQQREEQRRRDEANRGGGAE